MDYISNDNIENTEQIEETICEQKSVLFPGFVVHKWNPRKALRKIDRRCINSFFGIKHTCVQCNLPMGNVTWQAD